MEAKQRALEKGLGTRFPTGSFILLRGCPMENFHFRFEMDKTRKLK